MKLNTLLSLSMIALATLFSSCEDTATTKSGVVVSYESRGDEALKDSSVLLINMRYITETGADLFNSAERGGPITLPYYAAQWDTSRVFYEVLSTVKVGDSISFQIDATELYLKTFGQPVPDSIGAESNIQFYVGVEDQMTFDEFQEYRVARVEKEQAKMAEEEKSRTEEQGAEIDTFLSENGIEDVVVTESGLRYVITESAEGPKPVAGDVVIVHYNGTLMDSTKFDSSYDRDQPFEFPLGQGRVIPGWDEGIALLNVGSKATLFVPSALAYGPRGAGGIIKPNSILKFEVELIGIK
ncbi:MULTISPECIES: FKBP-type peptidyl-prolyl cis-trans isomerase [Reichenbachiella]|uniref:Peptidyl-prolyl cis-trans isomerase n=1 Tax=Reichenbachiella agariperforans TaxID=156994 RepID=A0A1M6VWW0_REIAG|nr:MULTISPECIES: FKBP-type peptidyl-prolyl cis-trans isomerase [Reichenbachiella]MBU2915293.1 FKBP-type peptidyl-prolyl cis-trans isomerase [Reichenbachiella agariperforans]SHK85805.1 FKBP-type peptidyl-prolyl cis-trans isomerase [Reichenbachiella agariperforans]